jgi:hypothetical protein
MRISSLVVTFVLVVMSACGPKGGHETDSRGPFNLVVQNDSNASLEVFVSSSDMGTVDAGRTGFFWINPGVKDLNLISDADDANGNPISEYLRNVLIPSTGYVQETFYIQ